MEYSPEVRVIAHIENDFSDKFGIPRQSGLADNVSKIVFCKEFCRSEAVKGLEGFSHIWLLWCFSLAKGKSGLTVRPPRLGGNKRVGVFATRSPYRPSKIGLSSVKIEKIETEGADAPAIYVRGADLANGTPIIDIKPYIPYTDCHTDAIGGFAEEMKDYALDVNIPDALTEKIGKDKIKELKELLSQDPRPSYQNDGERIYGFVFAGKNVCFFVKDGVLTVTDITDMI